MSDASIKEITEAVVVVVFVIAQLIIFYLLIRSTESK